MRVKRRRRSKEEEEEQGGGGLLLVGAAGGSEWDAGQSGGPAEQVGAVWSLLDKLWHSLKHTQTHTYTHKATWLTSWEAFLYFKERHSTVSHVSADVYLHQGGLCVCLCEFVFECVLNSPDVCRGGRRSRSLWIFGIFYDRSLRWCSSGSAGLPHSSESGLPSLHENTQKR